MIFSQNVWFSTTISFQERCASHFLLVWSFCTEPSSFQQRSELQGLVRPLLSAGLCQLSIVIVLNALSLATLFVPTAGIKIITTSLKITSTTTSAKNITSKVWWDVRPLGGAGGKGLPNASTHSYRSIWVPLKFAISVKHGIIKA